MDRSAITDGSSLGTRERTFQVWEYLVSHGQLLIRSPKAPATAASSRLTSNVDLVFRGVDYMAVPRVLRGVELASANEQEARDLEAILGKSIPRESIRILVSEGHRFPVVASFSTISENDWDIFESPFEFHCQFRGSPRQGAELDVSGYVTILLQALSDERFREPVEILRAVVDAGGACGASSRSRRFIPTTELMSTYSFRRERARALGRHLPGLEGLVDVLGEHPEDAWQIVTIAGGEVCGAVFVARSGLPVACIAGRDARVDE